MNAYYMLSIMIAKYRSYFSLPSIPCICCSSLLPSNLPNGSSQPTAGSSCEAPFFLAVEFPPLTVTAPTPKEEEVLEAVPDPTKMIGAAKADLEAMECWQGSWGIVGVKEGA
jgi:hypothetical protein